jgi:chemotaxis protein methyltransferase CheR
MIEPDDDRDVFLRQEYQLRAFRDELLPRIAKANADKRRLVVWSAGCSTGEEAYSLAALIHQSRLFVDWDVRVVGSDISKSNIAAARRGVYRGSAFRSTPAEFQATYFVERDDGHHVVDWLRKSCYFGHLNLLDGIKATTLGRGAPCSAATYSLLRRRRAPRRRQSPED